MMLRRVACRALLALAALLPLGCAIPLEVDEGESTVAGAMLVRADRGWTHLAVVDRPWTAWTHDGTVIDELRFWARMNDGQPIAPPDSPEQRPLSFRRTMQPHDLVALFASLQARDGSAVTVDKIEPAQFVGVPGVRFSYSVLRSADDLRLAGVGWAAVRDDQLYAMTFVAPRLDFFGRHAAQVERIAKSAKAKGSPSGPGVPAP
jgi:hypothetical protein